MSFWGNFDLKTQNCGQNHPTYHISIQLHVFDKAVWPKSPKKIKKFWKNHYLFFPLWPTFVFGEFRPIYASLRRSDCTGLKVLDLRIPKIPVAPSGDEREPRYKHLKLNFDPKIMKIRVISLNKKCAFFLFFSAKTKSAKISPFRPFYGKKSFRWPPLKFDFKSKYVYFLLENMSVLAYDHVLMVLAALCFAYVCNCMRP